MNFTEKKLPIIYLDINLEDETSGVDFVSFVDSPATEVTWHKYNGITPQNFEKNDVKRIVTSPIMLAETPIYRISPLIGEYYCKFSEKTIFNMMLKYFKLNKSKNINENHDSNRIVDNVMLVESFIVGDKVSSSIFKDLPKGSWMGSFHIEDEKYWNEVIMSDEFTGFSLEGGFFERIEDDIIDELYNNILKTIDSKATEQEIIIELKKMLKID